MDVQVVEQPRDPARELRRGDVEPGDGQLQVAVLALERVDLLAVLPALPKRSEDAVLLASDVTGQVPDELS